MSHLTAVDEDRRLDMGALQEERDTPVVPVLRYIDGSPIPGVAREMTLRSQEEGELHLTLVAIFLHIGIEIERRVVERPRPLGVDADRIAFAIGQQRTWQHDIVVIMDGVVQTQVPRAAKVNGLRPNRTQD